MRRVVFGIVCLVLIAGVMAAEVPRQGEFRAAPFDRVIEMGPVTVPQTVDRAIVQRERENLHAWLMAEQVVAGIEDPVTVDLTAEELEDIEFGRETGHLRTPEAQRAGLVKPVSVEFVLRNTRWGAARGTPEGGRVWSGAVKSSGAFGLRVHFDNFWLPPDTELYLFNAAGEVFGPYTEAGPFDTGEFWSHTVRGEVAYLQLRQYGSASPDKLDNTYFDLIDIGHVSGAFGVRQTEALAKAFCSYNDDCVENVSCVENVHPAVSDAQKGVAHMQYVKRPYIYICSGGLIASSVNSSNPYFLTANHCISRDREASTLEAYFFYEIGCTGSCPDQWSKPDTEMTLGSSVVVTNKTGDYTLLQLSEPAPAGTVLLGWSTDPVAFTNGADLYRISHPSGAPQAYSEHTVDLSDETCSSWPRGSWIYSRDTLGATEGGSSGSPVVNADGEIVGQLSGACGTNLDDNCDAVNNATVDGAFASYYSEVAQYLGSAGECEDADGDGYDDDACGGSDCNDNDSSINPGIDENCDNGIDDDCDLLVDGNDPDCGGCVPTAEICDNGVDDDCDGFVDGDDPDCQQACAPAGDACTTNSDCCSVRCHPRRLTCK